jgi:Zn-dependent protease with chaperone function
MRLAIFVTLFVLGSAVLLELAMVVVPGALLSLLADDSAAYLSAFLLFVLGSFVLLLFVGAVLAAVQLSNAEHWVTSRFGGAPIAEADAPGLFRAVHDMTLAAGLADAPRLVVLDAPADSVNAFAVGTTRRQPLIGVTPGFLEHLDESEQRAVVATLVARIIAGDVMFGTALAALMGPIKAIRSLHKSGAATGAADACCVDTGCFDGCGGCADIGDLDADGCGGAIGLVLFLAFVAAVTYAAVMTAAWIVTIWGRLLHKTAYEKADAEGMLLLKDPSPMLTALAKTSRLSNALIQEDPSYDGVFYAATSGRPGIDKVERRRYDRLREVLGIHGLAAEPLD